MNILSSSRLVTFGSNSSSIVVEFSVLHVLFFPQVVVRSSLFLALQFVSYTCSHYGEIVATVVAQTLIY